jgi:hypothetical protein
MAAETGRAAVTMVTLLLLMMRVVMVRVLRVHGMHGVLVLMMMRRVCAAMTTRHAASMAAMVNRHHRIATAAIASTATDMTRCCSVQLIGKIVRRLVRLRGRRHHGARDRVLRGRCA